MHENLLFFGGEFFVRLCICVYVVVNKSLLCLQGDSFSLYSCRDLISFLLTIQKALYSLDHWTTMFLFCPTVTIL